MQARIEAEQIKQQDEEARKKREAKELGVKYVPPRKPKPPTLSKGKLSLSGERRRKSHESRRGSSADDLQPTVLTFNPAAKAEAIRKAKGITAQQQAVPLSSKPHKRIRVRHEDSSDEQPDRSRYDYDSSASSNDQEGRDTEDDDADEITRHLRRKWVNKRHPERMTKARAKMEEKHNPLITLLSECKSRSPRTPYWLCSRLDLALDPARYSLDHRGRRQRDGLE
jgi:hypothetical protein